jgi:lactoylglutathione lyase
MRNVIRHVGVVVNDMDEVSKFWINTIGLTLHKEVQEPSPYIDELIAVENPDLTTLKLIDANGFIIELLKFENNQVGVNWSGKLNYIGLTHIALTVSNLDEIIKKVKMSAFETLSEIKNSPDNKVRLVFVRGPEGTILELVEEII